jgi:hypothetical protein
MRTITRSIYIIFAPIAVLSIFLILTLRDVGFWNICKAIISGISSIPKAFHAQKRKEKTSSPLVLIVGLPLTIVIILINKYPS